MTLIRVEPRRSRFLCPVLGHRWRLWVAWTTPTGATWCGPRMAFTSVPADAEREVVCDRCGASKCDGETVR